VPTNDQGSIYLVEIYAITSCHMGTNSDFTIISFASSLRKTLISKGEGILKS
jgi:hypothetical protein